MKTPLLGYRHPSISVYKSTISNKKKLLVGTLVLSSFIIPDASIGIISAGLVASPIGFKKALKNKIEDVSDFAKRKYQRYKK